MFATSFVKNPFGLFRLLFSASSVIYKSYRQVLTPSIISSAFKGCLFLTRLDLLHSIKQQYKNRFLPVRENESAHDLDSLHAIMKTIVTEGSPQSDDAKLWHFDATVWINFIITPNLIENFTLDCKNLYCQRCSSILCECVNEGQRVL